MIWYSLTGSEKRSGACEGRQLAHSDALRRKNTRRLTDFLNRLDLAVLYKATELGDGHPLLLLILACATTGPATGSTTVSTSTAEASTVSGRCCGCARHTLRGARGRERVSSGRQEARGFWPVSFPDPPPPRFEFDLGREKRPFRPSGAPSASPLERSTPVPPKVSIRAARAVDTGRVEVVGGEGASSGGGSGTSSWGIRYLRVGWGRTKTVTLRVHGLSPRLRRPPNEQRAKLNFCASLRRTTVDPLKPLSFRSFPSASSGAKC